MADPVLDYHQPQPPKKTRRLWAWGLVSIVMGFVVGILYSGDNKLIWWSLCIAMVALWLAGLSLIFISIVRWWRHRSNNQTLR